MKAGWNAPLWRRLTATLAAALLALQSALPMVAPAAESDAAAFWRELGVDLAGAICRTANGAEVPGAPAPGAPHDDHHPLLCKVLCGASAPTLAAVAPPAGPERTEAAALPALAAATWPIRQAGAAQPRAPPRFA